MKFKHKKRSLRLLYNKMESISWGAISRLYVVTEDTYAGAEYIDILSSIYNLNRNIKIIPIKNTKLIGGTSPDKLLIYICAFKHYLSKDGFFNFNRANERMLSRCAEIGLNTRNTIIDKISEENYINYFCDIENLGIPRSIKDDIFYICCDVDNTREDTFKKCEKLANEFKIKLLISNISIETWFLLHFKSDYNEKRDVKSTLQILEKKFEELGSRKKYMTIVKIKNKGKDITYHKKSLEGLEKFFTKERIESATNTSKEAHKIEGRPIVPSNPGSTMYKLLDDINTLVNRSIHSTC